MRARGLAAPLVALAASSLVPCALVVVILIDHKLTQIGRGDLSVLHVETLAFPAAMLSSATVGAVLVFQLPRHPVGWLFLALGDLVAIDGVATAYVAYGSLARPGSLPASDIVASLASVDFVLWLIVLALILHVTPTGSPLSRAWGALAWATALCGIGWAATGLLRSGPLPSPWQHISNPLSVESLGGAVDWAGRWPGYATGVGVLLAAGSLLIRFHRAEGLARQRLLWMAVAAALLPGFVAVSFIASRAGSEAGVAVVSGGFVTLLPVAAGLSVTRYHLYDVDRVLSRAVTYLLVSGLLAGSYLAAIFVVGQSFGGSLGRSRFADVAATLAAVAVAAPSYRHIQESVDSRFNRRKFEALRQVREFVRDPAPGRPVQDVLRSSLGDPGISVAYWIGSRQTWVTAEGLAVRTGPDDVVVRRQGRPVASIAFDPALADLWLVEAAAAEAATEFDNAGLRADLALRLFEVKESRVRLASAQVNERRKIERDLHDGAQQRLLALALELRAAHETMDLPLLRGVVENSIQQLQAAIVELRELANGVHPAVLTTGGLLSALDDLVSRTPLPVDLSVPDERFAPEVEATAWFIACEAVANAVKHGSPTRITISVVREPGQVVIVVQDDGSGGADPEGQGLRGITDRAEAIGGALDVTSDACGTTIRAELPCAS